eukprot:scaffold17189_cov28-Tisochrysis_lutea.AAC.5
MASPASSPVPRQGAAIPSQPYACAECIGGVSGCPRTRSRRRSSSMTVRAKRSAAHREARVHAAKSAGCASSYPRCRCWASRRQRRCAIESLPPRLPTVARRPAPRAGAPPCAAQRALGCQLASALSSSSRLRESCSSKSTDTLPSANRVGGITSSKRAASESA